jgi:tetratricopeptide (TPR) repeat protein
MIHQRVQLLFLILSFFSLLLGAGEATVCLEAYNVCLVIENNSPVYADYRDQSKVMGRFNLGEVIIALDRIENVSEREYYEILIPSGETAWIKNVYCQVMSLNYVNGSGKKDLYPVFSSPLKQKVIANKKKADRFNIRKMALIRSGKTFEMMSQVSYQSYDPKIYWMKNHEEGWVKRADIGMSLEPIYLESARRLVYETREPLDCRLREMERAKELLERIIRHYPGVYFFRQEPTKAVAYSSVEALRGIERIYVKQKQYRRGIKVLKQLIRECPDIYSCGQRSESYAYRDMAWIYWKYMNQPQKALDILQKVIKDFSSEAVWGFEFKSTCGMMALSEISIIAKEYKLSPTLKLKQFRRAMKNAASSAVKITSAQMVANLLRDGKKFRRAVNQLYSLIKKYPCTYYEDWYSSENQSISALAKIVDILVKDLDIPRDAVRICQEFYLNTKDLSCGNENVTVPEESLSTAALYFKNVILDYTEGPRDVVIANYRQLLEMLPRTDEEVKTLDKELQDSIHYSRNYKSFFWSWEGISFKYYPAWVRLKEIQAFTPGKRKVVDLVPMYKYPDPKSTVLKTISPYTEVLALYNINIMYKIPWVKIKLPDGYIGWVSQSQLK